MTNGEPVPVGDIIDTGLCRSTSGVVCCSRLTAPFERAFVGLGGLSLRADGAGLLNLEDVALGFGDCDLVCDCDLDWMADVVAEVGVDLASGLVLFNCSKRANREDTGFWCRSAAVLSAHLQEDSL